MSSSAPILSIGMPVYNGEAFIREALDSLLSQTFGNFELIISDNASTDKTADIYQDYAARDRRIRYYRNQENIGAAPNFNRAFELSKSQYFLWFAHDDTCAPTYLERCLDVLENDPSVVLCHAQLQFVNEQGSILQEGDALYQKFPRVKRYHDRMARKLNTDSFQTKERFRARIRSGFNCYAIFGVMRSDILRKTPLIGGYSASDDALLARLSLYGRFYEIPERLFFSRQHLQQSGMFALAEDGKLSHQNYSQWFDANGKHHFVSIYWKLFQEHASSIAEVPLKRSEKIGCYTTLLDWLWRKRRRIFKDYMATRSLG
jgi:glycosyltransferase involved in cell wall biosynthesis